MSADDEKYDRYGLGGNPFRRTTENSVETVSRVHANLSIDDQLASLKEEAFFKRKSHSVFLVGDHGMGKTHRMMVAHAEAVQNTLFSRVISFSRKNRPAMYQFVKAFLPKGSALFSNDKWQRELAKVKKEAKKGSYQPQMVAQQVAAALNTNTPSFVLIDNLDDVQILSDNQVFLQFLFHLSSLLQPGVFLMVTMSSSFGAWLLKQYPQVQNLVQFVYLQPLTSEDAEKVIGKWLESNRLVDGLHSLFPFSPDAVSLLNSQSHGNVSSLLDLSDMALTAASYQKAVVITDLTVKEALLSVKEQKPAVLEEKEKQASLSEELSSLIEQEPVTTSEPDSLLSPVKPVSATDLLGASTDNDIVKHSSSDIIDLPNSEGGSEKEIDGEQVDTHMSSFSNESPNKGMKDINQSSPSLPHKPGSLNDDLIMDDDSVDDQKQDEWSRMKTDEKPLVSQGDNGSKSQPDEPASIMHQAKQEMKRKKKEKNNVDTQSDESLSEAWEPVDEEESIDDKQESSDAESVEEPGSEHESVSSDETKEEEITEPKDGSAKTDEELETKDSSEKNEEKQEKHSEQKQEVADELNNSVQTQSLPHPITDSKGKEGDDEASKQVKQNTEEKQDKATDSLTQEKNPQNDTSDTSKQSHQIKQHRPQVTQHNEQVHPHQVDSAKQVLRVRCPECSKDFTIELDEHTHSLTCPFCGFQGEL